MKLKIGILILFFFLSACENMNSKKYTRTPHMPIFPEVTPNERSRSNPYWTRFTAYEDKASVKLNNLETHNADSPSIVGALGTHYRWPQNIYFYAMTGGSGLQYDYFINEKSKISPQIYLGIEGNRGIQVSYSHLVTSIFDVPLTAFLAVQRQEIFVEIECNTNNGKKPCNKSLGVNHVFADQDVMNTLVGLQWGRYKIGSKGYTSVNFRLELGVHKVLSGKIKKEDYPSGFTWEESSPMVAFTTDFTLW